MLYFNRNDDQVKEEDGEEEKPEEEKEKEETEPSMWEESFSGNTDAKPRGPESIGVDIDFPHTEHLYGIPEHTDNFMLKDTRLYGYNLCSACHLSVGTRILIKYSICL